MTLSVVTGAAGFIGSHLTESLLSGGGEVRGLDSFSDYYRPEVKRSNLALARDNPRFELVEIDLRRSDLMEVLSGADVVFHLAGQPGVRGSFADGFPLYAEQNIMATQRLLEAAKASGTKRVVFASSSSVYGNATSYPTSEDDLPRPFSPYGVTKLAAEHLCRLYAANWGLHTVSLRYFSVYGPRQRPDMAMYRLIRSSLHGDPFPVFGNGRQIRDFTYVADVVQATRLAATADVPAGSLFNVSGGSSTSLLDVIGLVDEITGTPPVIEWRAAEAGDVARTGGAAQMAKKHLGWQPLVSLREGLVAQVEWATSYARSL